MPNHRIGSWSEWPLTEDSPSPFASSNTSLRSPVLSPTEVSVGRLVFDPLKEDGAETEKVTLLSSAAKELNLALERRGAYIGTRGKKHDAYGTRVRTFFLRLAFGRHSSPDRNVFDDY